MTEGLITFPILPLNVARRRALEIWFTDSLFVCLCLDQPTEPQFPCPQNGDNNNNHIKELASGLVVINIKYLDHNECAMSLSSLHLLSEAPMMCQIQCENLHPLGMQTWQDIIAVQSGKRYVKHGNNSVSATRNTNSLLG